MTTSETFWHAHLYFEEIIFDIFVSFQAFHMLFVQKKAESEYFMNQMFFTALNSFLPTLFWIIYITRFTNPGGGVYTDFHLFDTFEST